MTLPEAIAIVQKIVELPQQGLTAYMTQEQIEALRIVLRACCGISQRQIDKDKRKRGVE